MKAGSEAAWQQQVEQLARFYGWSRQFHAPDNRPTRARSGRVYVQNVTPGWPDLVLVRVPELLIAELKTDVGRVAPEQRDWLDALAACGVEVHVWRPRDFDAVHERLARGRNRVEPTYREAA